MANESIAPAADVAPVVNEAIVGSPKEPIVTTTIEDAPIVPVAKRKIKWGDTEKEVTIDEAVKLAEKAFGIEEKAKVSAQKAQQAEAIMDMLANNPKEFAKRCRAAGLDPP